VEAAFGLSYAQLSDSTRQTFRRLSLVPGADFGTPLAAVLAQSGVLAVEEHLDELADLGLLQSDRGDRYRFHDLIRLFARARLQAEEPDSYRRPGIGPSNTPPRSATSPPLWPASGPDRRTHLDLRTLDLPTSTCPGTTRRARVGRSAPPCSAPASRSR